MNKSVTYIVGATVLVGGAYLFLKNKKAKDLSKLTELGGTTTGGATTGGTTSSTTTSTGTITQNNEVFLPSDKDMKLIDATVLVGKIKALRVAIKKPFVGTKFKDSINQNENRPSDWTFEYTQYRNGQSLMPKQIESYLNALDDLDYSLDANDNLVKLDPNRNKEWIKIQKLYLSLVNLSGTALFFRQQEVLELAKYGYKIDPITKKLVKI
jgi:hypothetical protein